MTQRTKPAVGKEPPSGALILSRVEAAMRALPLPEFADAYVPPRPLHPHERGIRVETPSEVREQIISHLAEKYVDMRRDSDPSPAKGDIESQFAAVEEQARALLTRLYRLKTPAIDALNRAIAESAPPPIDPRPKALGDIQGRLAVLIEAASRAEVPTAKSQRGPALKSDALAIAKAAVRDYYHLTSKRPDRGKSGYFAFLAAIFKALGRPKDDSVEGLGRRAIKWFESGDAEREAQVELGKLLANSSRVVEERDGI
jgi:hypothetical protein